MISYAAVLLMCWLVAALVTGVITWVRVHSDDLPAPVTSHQINGKAVTR